jgi:hypothetical protein
MAQSSRDFGEEITYEKRKMSQMRLVEQYIGDAQVLARIKEKWGKVN